MNPQGGEEGVAQDYLSLIFDHNRFGFNTIAERFLFSYLDYPSFVCFKRSCRLIYDFIKASNLDSRKIQKTLRIDWRSQDEARKHVLHIPGDITSGKFFNSDRFLLCSAGQRLFIFDLSSEECVHTYRGHNAQVTSCDVLQHKDGFVVASGSIDGVLILWDAITGETFCEKQLFGRISALKFGRGFLVTCHFGKAMDAGCISIRKFNSTSDLPVIFNIFDDAFPMLDLDFNSRFLVILRWRGMLNGVHSGYVNVYNWMEQDFFADLAALAQTSFTKCRFLEGYDDELLVTAGHDKLIRLWRISSTKSCMCLRFFQGHSDAILALETCLERVISRDLKGNTLIWDIPYLVAGAEYWDDAVVIRKCSSKTFHGNTAIVIGMRCFAIGSLDKDVLVFDVWRESPLAQTT